MQGVCVYNKCIKVMLIMNMGARGEAGMMLKSWGLTSERSWTVELHRETLKGLRI